jgi:phosphoserine phosphatase
MTAANEFAPGLAIQGFTAPLKLQDFKLIAFDMDSTLITSSALTKLPMPQAARPR